MQFGRIYVLLVATCCDSHRDVFTPEPSDDSGRRNMSIFLHLFWRVILDPLGLSSRVGAVQLADLGCIRKCWRHSTGDNVSCGMPTQIAIGRWVIAHLPID